MIYYYLVPLVVWLLLVLLVLELQPLLAWEYHAQCYLPSRDPPLKIYMIQLPPPPPHSHLNQEKMTEWSSTMSYIPTQSQVPQRHLLQYHELTAHPRSTSKLVSYVILQVHPYLSCTIYSMKALEGSLARSQIVYEPSGGVRAPLSSSWSRGSNPTSTKLASGDPHPHIISIRHPNQVLDLYLVYLSLPSLQHVQVLIP